MPHQATVKSLAKSNASRAELNSPTSCTTTTNEAPGDVAREKLIANLKSELEGALAISTMQTATLEKVRLRLCSALYGLPERYHHELEGEGADKGEGESDGEGMKGKGGGESQGRGQSESEGENKFRGKADGGDSGDSGDSGDGRDSGKDQEKDGKRAGGGGVGGSGAGGSGADGSGSKGRGEGRDTPTGTGPAGHRPTTESGLKLVTDLVAGAEAALIRFRSQSASLSDQVSTTFELYP